MKVRALVKCFHDGAIKNIGDEFEFDGELDARMQEVKAEVKEEIGEPEEAGEAEEYAPEHKGKPKKGKSTK